VVLIDESDEHTFSNPSAFEKFIRKAPCICLTATAAEDAVGGIERSVLKAMKFKIFENIANKVGTNIETPVFERIKCGSIEMMKAFLNQEIKKQSVILYCTTEEKE